MTGYIIENGELVVAQVGDVPTHTVAPVTPPATRHIISLFEEDEDGWWVAECACGWITPPVPGADDAADMYGDHRAAEAFREGTEAAAGRGF